MTVKQSTIYLIYRKPIWMQHNTCLRSLDMLHYWAR